MVHHVNVLSVLNNVFFFFDDIICFKCNMKNKDFINVYAFVWLSRCRLATYVNIYEAICTFVNIDVK